MPRGKYLGDSLFWLSNGITFNVNYAPLYRLRKETNEQGEDVVMIHRKFTFLYSFNTYWVHVPGIVLVSRNEMIIKSRQKSLPSWGLNSSGRNILKYIYTVSSFIASCPGKLRMPRKVVSIMWDVRGGSWEGNVMGEGRKRKENSGDENCTWTGEVEHWGFGELKEVIVSGVQCG